MQKTNSDRAIYFICLACVIVWTIIGAVWQSLDSRPPTWDSAYHTSSIIDCSRGLFKRFRQVGISACIANTYPPLVYFVLSPFAQFSTASDFLTVVLNGIFGMILATAIFGICRCLQMPSAAVGATVLSLAHPFIGIISRKLFLDFPLCVMAVLALYFVFLCLDNFSWKHCGLLGISLGLGMLTKPSFSGFLFLPVCYLVVSVMRRCSQRKEIANNLLKFLTSIVIACLTCGWWFVYNFEHLSKYFQYIRFRVKNIDHFPNVGSFSSISFYLSELVGRAGSIIPFVLFLIGLVSILRVKMKGHGLLIVFFIGCYGSLTITPIKDLRIALTLIPAMALITALGLTQIKRVLWQKFFMVLLYIYCIFQIGFQYFLQQPRFLKNANFQFAGLNWTIFSDVSIHFLPTYPKKENWYLGEIVKEVSNPLDDQKGTNGLKNVLVLVDQMYHNVNVFSYEARRLGVEVNFVTIAGEFNEEKRKSISREQFDYVVYRPITYEHWPSFINDIKELHYSILVSQDNYHVIKTFLLPDGETLYIYKHNESVLNGSS
ncbi:MAG: glycosyltransferase family 39 protein [Candidatus Omnitrophica bacterium]|nr:glycosyltransferase family 39 protein [Candidatus Omnitrophota bacterium]